MKDEGGAKSAKEREAGRHTLHQRSKLYLLSANLYGDGGSVIMGHNGGLLWPWI